MIKYEFDLNRSRVKLCPCGKRNRDGKFCPFKGSNNEGYCHSCSRLITNSSNREHQRLPIDIHSKQLVISKKPEVAIDMNEKAFTQISSFKTENVKIIDFLSINQVVEKLKSSLPRNDKHAEVGILKGIYQNETSGKFCYKTNNYLFFDIDVKEDQNKVLMDRDLNAKVFQFLKSVSILTWRSNSGLGIAGLLYVEGMSKFNNETRLNHLKSARAVYSFLSQLILQLLNCRIVFDEQQGKFRQIRYLANQKSLINVNLNFTTFKIDEIGTHIVDRINSKLFEKSLQQGKDLEKLAASNNFIFFLHKRFDSELILKVIGDYYIGTSRHWNKSTIFWQVDKGGGIRTGKIILYDPISGKRCTEPQELIYWVHKKLKLKEFALSQCLFGEHLLDRPENKLKKIAIVESEKTAIIASMFIPDFVWLATGGKDGFNYTKCSVLKGREVIIFPDRNAHDQWIRTLYKMPPIFKYKVSSLLSKIPGSQSDDIADFLLQINTEDLKIPERGSDAIDQSIEYQEFINENYSLSDFHNFRKKILNSQIEINYKKWMIAQLDLIIKTGIERRKNSPELQFISTLDKWIS